MSLDRLCVLGIGSVRCGAPVVASLANYFGDRPLKVTFYDADNELLDVFDRLARLCFMANRANHQLISTDDLAEALENSTHVLITASENCATKYMKALAEESVGRQRPLALEKMAHHIPREANLLRLVNDEIFNRNGDFLEWPPTLGQIDRFSMPFQLLRWINEEEGVDQLLHSYEHNPIKSWLSG